MNPQLAWWVARSSGIVAWFLLAASVIWGTAFASRLTKHPKPAWVLDLHRFLAGTAVVFVGIHIAALIADSFVDIDLVDVLVPFAASWRPLAVAFGVVGFWLLLAIETSSLMMQSLPRRLWRAIHLSSVGLFVAATAHFVLAGSDVTNVIVATSALVATAIVVFVVVVRVLSGRGDRVRRTPVASPGGHT